jgi:predicted RNA-binding protein with PIN domain
MDELARFAGRERVSVSVVFDGAPEEHFPDGARYRGISIFYAERGSNADERIKRMVDDSRERRTLYVVTSDRALADYVRLCGAKVIRSGDFRRRIDEAHAEGEELSSPAKGRDGVPRAEMDKWMRYFGVESEDEE